MSTRKLVILFSLVISLLMSGIILAQVTLPENNNNGVESLKPPGFNPSSRGVRATTDTSNETKPTHNPDDVDSPSDRENKKPDKKRASHAPGDINAPYAPDVILGNWFYVGGSLGGQPDVAHNFNYDEYLVTWTGSEVDGSGWNHAVYARVFDKSGDAYGNAKFIGYRQQNEPKVAFNPYDDEYLIGWGPYGQLYVQRLRWDGTPLGTAVQVYSNVGMTAGLLEIVYNYVEKEYFLLFQDEDWKLRGQRVDQNGVLIGSSFVIRDSNCGGDVAYNWHSNTYLVVGTFYNDERDIWGYILDGANGGLLGTVTVENFADDQDCPKVAWNSYDNEYLVIWADDWNDKEAIYGRRLEQSGARTGNYVVLASESPGSNITYPDDIAFNWNNGSFVAGWHDSWVGDDYQEHWRSYVRSITRDGRTPFPRKSVEYEFLGQLAITKGQADKYVVVETDTSNGIWGRFLQPWQEVFLPTIMR